MIRVSRSLSQVSGSHRWYVWQEGRKTRLPVYLRRLTTTGHHEQVALVLTKAIKKGYRLTA
jgi:hypothetical protein